MNWQRIANEWLERLRSFLTCFLYRRQETALGTGEKNRSHIHYICTSPSRCVKERSRLWAGKNVRTDSLRKDQKEVTNAEVINIHSTLQISRRDYESAKSLKVAGGRVDT